MTAMKPVASIDSKAIDDLTKGIEEVARTICAEQPDVPAPTNLDDLDSFSMVQVLLDLENSLDMKLLEKMERFEGGTFRDLAEFILRLVDEAEAETAAAEAGPAQPASTDRPASA